MDTPLTFYDPIIDYCRPHPQLSPFIEQYVYQKMMVPQGCCVKKIAPLRSSSSIDFFIGDNFDIHNIKTGEMIPFTRCSIQGPRTQVSHFIQIKGVFISISIIFKATGLFRLLGIPMDLFVDRSINGNVIDRFPAEEIIQKLLYAPNLKYCFLILEPYLLLLVEKCRTVPIIIENATRLLEEYHKLYSISLLAKESYLSIRQLERYFTRYVGISPKSYFRMYRFLQLLKAKNDSPQLKWGALAYDFGYYDQTHLIKEFKHFLKTTPSLFIPSDLAF